MLGKQAWVSVICFLILPYIYWLGREKTLQNIANPFGSRRHTIVLGWSRLDRFHHSSRFFFSIPRTFCGCVKLTRNCNAENRWKSRLCTATCLYICVLVWVLRVPWQTPSWRPKLSMYNNISQSPNCIFSQEAEISTVSSSLATPLTCQYRVFYGKIFPARTGYFLEDWYNVDIGKIGKVIIVVAARRVSLYDEHSSYLSRRKLR